MGKFYEFHQNNSGGGFDFVEGAITTSVIIEADSASEANARLEALGGYFDGTSGDSDWRVDCHTCGDRWYEVSEGDGRDVPSHYGAELKISGEQQDPHGYGLSIKWQGPDRPEYYIHYLDGRVVGCNG